MTYQNRKQPRASAMLSVQRWNQLSDFIDLAKDALGEKPQDFNGFFFANCEIQLQSAMEILAARRRNDRPWGEPATDESPTIQRIREAMRIMRNFANVIDKQAPDGGQFGIPSLAINWACGELAEALRLEGAA